MDGPRKGRRYGGALDFLTMKKTERSLDRLYSVVLKFKFGSPYYPTSVKASTPAQHLSVPALPQVITDLTSAVGMAYNLGLGHVRGDGNGEPRIVIAGKRKTGFVPDDPPRHVPLEDPAGVDCLGRRMDGRTSPKLQQPLPPFHPRPPTNNGARTGAPRPRRSVPILNIPPILARGSAPWRSIRREERAVERGHPDRKRKSPS